MREVRPASEIERDTDQAFIHGQLQRGVAAESFSVAQGLVDGAAQNQANVLDGVVLVDLDVPLSPER